MDNDNPPPDYYDELTNIQMNTQESISVLKRILYYCGAIATWTFCTMILILLMLLSLEGII